MRFPEVQGQIERRLLVNYRVDPDAIAGVLPRHFRPQLVGDAAVAGICLIRLGEVPPLHAAMAGPAARERRIAVERDTPNGPQTGVYIPRCDTDSWANVMLGGRLYPGVHHRARFRVDETDTDVRVAYESPDHATNVDISVHLTNELTDSRLFGDLGDASAFFEAGSVGYSATGHPHRFDGLKLRTTAWKVEATSMTHAHPSFFDAATFPAGTVALDSALLMRRVPVLWEPLPSLRPETDRAA